MAAVLTAVGSSIDDHELDEWLVVPAISAVAAIVFWVVYPRVQHLGRTALIVDDIGAVTILVSETGLPSIFAGTAAALALTARQRGTETGVATGAPVAASLVDDGTFSRYVGESTVKKITAGL